MNDYIAQRDFPHRGRTVRQGDRVTLSESAARYPRLRGWIAPIGIARAKTAPAPAVKRPRKRTPRRKTAGTR